ncbi:MAG TPA: redoxin family protein [bacterium]|nr:redoxin family protein [bacterium]HPO51767.1 redoxin family protein [bacterium]
MNQVTFKGNPLNLIGRNIKVADFAPDFLVISSELEEVSLKKYEGKIKVITSFPSLDTPVCDLQVRNREFNYLQTLLPSNLLRCCQEKFCPH